MLSIPPSSFSKSIILTNNQILNIEASRIEIVPAPGIDKTLIFHAAWFKSNNLAQYTNADPFGILDVEYGNSVETTVSTFAQLNDAAIVTASPGVLHRGLFGADNVGVARRIVLLPYQYMASEPTNVYVSRFRTNVFPDDVSNQPLVIGGYSNDDNVFGGGTALNTIRVTVFYSVEG